MTLINITRRHFEKKILTFSEYYLFLPYDCSVLKKLHLLFGFGGFLLYIHLAKENNPPVTYTLQHDVLIC